MIIFPSSPRQSLCQTAKKNALQEDIRRQVTETIDLLHHGSSQGSYMEVMRSLELDPVASVKRDLIKKKLFQLEERLGSLQNKLNQPPVLTKEQLFDRLCSNFSSSQHLSKVIFELDAEIISSLESMYAQSRHLETPSHPPNNPVSSPRTFGESPSRRRRRVGWSCVIEQARSRNHMAMGKTKTSTNPKLLKITQTRDWRQEQVRSQLSEEMTISSVVLPPTLQPSQPPQPQQLALASKLNVPGMAGASS